MNIVIDSNVPLKASAECLELLQIVYAAVNDAATHLTDVRVPPTQIEIDVSIRNNKLHIDVSLTDQSETPGNGVRLPLDFIEAEDEINIRDLHCTLVGKIIATWASHLGLELQKAQKQDT